MFLVRTAALLAIPVILTGLLWAVIPAADIMSDEKARLIGFALLGIALLSTILVFRSATAPSPTPTARHAGPAGRGNEFRRGFVSAKTAPRKPRVPRANEVIALRRHRIEPRIVPSKPVAIAVPMLAPPTIATLRQRLQDRAELLWKQRVG